MTDLSHDEHDLARFGYKQELKRSLGVFSSFAVAFSYISPSTGIFALFFLGLTTVGGVFIWSWPIVAIGQLIVALGFAELSSHYPVAGSVFQWTKYLAGKTYSWFTGWIYLFAGILTVASVCATLPIALIPAFNNMGWNLANDHSNQRWVAIITLVIITVMNIFGVRLVAIVNNTGVLFEILGMVVFAFIVAPFHHHQSAGVIFHTGGTSLTTGTFLVAMFMSLYVIYGFDTASTLSEETKRPAHRGAEGRHRVCDRRVRDRRGLPLRDAARHPEHGDRDQGGVGAGADHRCELRQRVLDGLPARRLGGDLRLLPRDRDRDDPALLRHVTRRHAAGLALAPEGEPGAAHAGLRVHRDRDPLRHPVHPVRGRRDHRDRGDGDDLPQLPDREPRPLPRASARLAEDEGAVLARALGAADQPRRAHLRRRDAAQHRVAARCDEPAPDPRRRRSTSSGTG